MSNYQSHGNAETFALVPRGAGPSEQALSDVQDDPPQKKHTSLFGAHRTDLIVSYLIAITSIIFGGIAAASWIGGAFQMDPVPREIIALIIEILVTILTKTLGSIHGTSMRWALYHESQLTRRCPFCQSKIETDLRKIVLLISGYGRSRTCARNFILRVHGMNTDPKACKDIIENELYAKFVTSDATRLSSVGQLNDHHWNYGKAHRIIYRLT